MRLATAAAITLAALTTIAGCSSGGQSTSSASPITIPPPALPLRLGVIPTITQAPALIGAADGIFTRDLGPSVSFQLVPFATAKAEATALLSGQLDAAYADPGTTLTVWQASHGKLIKVISGAAAGPASQIVSLEVTQKYLSAHPSVVTGLLKAQIEANDLIHRTPLAAQAAANSEITTLTGHGLPQSAVTAAFEHSTFTCDPAVPAIAQIARQGVATGVIKPVPDLASLYYLHPLNTLLHAIGEAGVGGP